MAQNKQVKIAPTERSAATITALSLLNNNNLMVSPLWVRNTTLSDKIYIVKFSAPNAKNINNPPRLLATVVVDFNKSSIDLKRESNQGLVLLNSSSGNAIIASIQILASQSGIPDMFEITARTEKKETIVVFWAMPKSPEGAVAFTITPNHIKWAMGF